MPANPTPKTKPPAARVPRAFAKKVSLDSLGTLFIDFDPKRFKRGKAIAVTPCSTLRQAKAMAAFARLDEGEMIDRLVAPIANGQLSYYDKARAILTLTGHSAKST